MRLGWYQVWGIVVIVVGIIWIIRKNVPVGFESHPPSLYARGKWAVLLGVLAIILGLFVGLEIPKQIKIDQCLDSGGSYNYETDKCIKENPTSDRAEKNKEKRLSFFRDKTSDNAIPKRRAGRQQTAADMLSAFGWITE